MAGLGIIFTKGRRSMTHPAKISDLSVEQVMALISWEQRLRYANALTYPSVSEGEGPSVKRPAGVLPLFDFCRQSKGLNDLTVPAVTYSGYFLNINNPEGGGFPTIKSKLPLAKLYSRKTLQLDEREKLAVDEAGIQAKFDEYMIRAGKFYHKKSERERFEGFWRVLDTEANHQLITREYRDTLAVDDSVARASAASDGDREVVTEVVGGEAFFAYRDSVEFAKPADQLVNGALPLNISNFGALDENQIQHACDVIITKGGKVALGQRPDQRDLFALFGGLNERAAAMRASHVVFEVFDEAFGSGLLENEFYIDLINKIPCDHEKLLSLLSIDHEQAIIDAVLAKRDDIKASEENEQKQRVQLAEFARSVIKLAESVKQQEEEGYQSLEQVFAKALTPVTNSSGEQLVVTNDTDHRTTLSAVAQSQVYYLNLDDKGLSSVLSARGINLTAGDDMEAIKLADMKALFKHGWGEHGNILLRAILTLKEKSTHLPGEKVFAERGLAQLAEFKDDADGLQKTIENIATYLVNMIAHNSEYEKSLVDSQSSKLFSPKFNALGDIQRMRSENQPDVKILYHILMDGSVLPGKASFARSHELLNLAMPVRYKQALSMPGVEFLKDVIGCHPLVDVQHTAKSFSTAVCTA
jgi:hypothetical protein